MSARLLTAAACVLLWLPGSVQAQTAQPVSSHHGFTQVPQRQVGRYAEFIVQEHRNGIAAGSFTLPVSPEGYAIVHCPEAIQRAEGLANSQFKLTVKGRQVYIYTANKRPPKEAHTLLTLSSASGAFSITLRLTVASRAEDAIEQAFVLTQSEAEQREAEVATLLAGKTAELQSNYAALHSALEQKEAELHRSVHEKALQLAEEMMADQYLENVTVFRAAKTEQEPRPSALPDVHIENIEALRTGNRFYLLFDVLNGGPRPYELAETYLFDETRSTNHAGLVRLREPGAPAAGLIGIIPPDKRVKILVQVLGVRDVNTPLMLTLTEPLGLRPVMAAIPYWEYKLVPLNEEARRQEMTEEEIAAEDRERAEQGRVAVHLQGAYGVIWLTDGLGQDLVAATSLTGLGVRVLYGVNQLLAFEATAMGGRTGSARFEDAMYEGMSGTLARSAGLGRLEAGAKVRFGYPTIPFLRLGVGLQGGSIASTFMVDGNERSGLEPAFAFDGLWYFGGGVERRFWGDFVAGLGLSAMFLGRSATAEPLSTVSFEAGVYFGYSWRP